MKIIYYLFILIFISIMSLQAFADKNPQEELFINRKVKWTTNTNRLIKDALVLKGDNILIFDGDEPSERNVNEIYIIDKSGNELMSKSYSLASDVSVSQNGDRILIPYISLKSALGMPIFNVDVLDNSGNVIRSFKNVSTDGVKLSKNGKYIITTRIELVDNYGRFEAYDVEKGEKLTINIIKQGNHHFFADFISDNKVVILFQNYQRIKRDSQDIIRDRKARDRKADKMARRPKTIKMPTRFIIYNLTTGQVELEQEIYSQNGNLVWTSFRDEHTLMVSPDGKYIAIAGYNIPFIQKSASHPYTLLMFNNSGTKLWEIEFSEENSRYECIRHGVFIDDRELLIYKKSISSKLCLFDIMSGQTKWITPFGENAYGRIKSVTLEKKSDNLLFRVDGKKKLEGIWKFNRKTGELKARFKQAYLFNDFSQYPLIIKKNSTDLEIIEKE